MALDKCLIMSPQNKRDFCLLALKLIQCPDLELRELRELLRDKKYKLLDFHLKIFDSKLYEVYKNGVGSLLDMMHNLKQLISEPSVILPVINRTSVVGMYLRRLVVFFDKLSFFHVVSIFQSFQKYYEKGSLKKAIVECKNDTINLGHEVEMSLCDIAIPMYESAEIPEPSDMKNTDRSDREQTRWTLRQADLFIAQQASLIQTNEMAALTPPQLQEKIRDLVRSNPEYSGTHYLSYMNCLRVKEFCGAINSLFHGFDRSTLLSPDCKIPSQDDKNKGFRYAALNLAMLYAQFGHSQEALTALKEAVMLAHEVNDSVCLQYALAWLYKLSDESKEILMERSISKSSDLNLSYLTSLGIQSYAHYAGVTGGGPALIFDLLMKSDVLNCQHSMIDLLSNSYAQKAALWCMYGKSEMASLSSQLLLHLNTANPTQGVLSYSGEGTCQAMCNVANVLTEQGEYYIASLILYNAQENFPHEPLARWWILSQQILRFTEFMHNGKWQEAEQAIAQLAAIDTWESQLRKAELYLAKGNYPGAAACVNAVLDYCRRNAEEEYMSPTLRTRALILTAELQCCSGVATSGPSGAIALLTTALALAQSHSLDYLAVLVVLHLANLQLQMGLATQALKLVNESLLLVLSHGGEFDQARALLLYAKCKVAASANQPEEARKSVILEAIEILSKVKANFFKVEAYCRIKDTLYLQALLYNELGYVSDRKKCALKFRHWDIQYPTKIATTLFRRL